MKKFRLLSLFPALWSRTKYAFLLKVKRVHWGRDMRRSRFITYAICSILATYSIIHVAYEININFLAILYLPIKEFYMTQLVPFISSPLKWVGLHPGPIYKSLLVFSGIGAYIWSSAEFSHNRYILLFFFPDKQLRPGQFLPLDKIDWKKAGKPEMPVKFFSFKNLKKMAIRFLYKVFLTYTLLGLVATLLGVVSGIYRIIMYLYELALFILSQIVFTFQHLIAPLEKWGDDNYWGTKFFLSTYNYRQKLDNKLQGRLQRLTVIPKKQIGTVIPIVNGILSEVGRIAAITFVIVYCIVIIHST